MDRVADSKSPWSLNLAVADLRGSMGLVKLSFLPQIDPESPRNGISDVKIFRGSIAPDPPSLLCLRRSQIRTPLHKIRDLPQPSQVAQPCIVNMCGDFTPGPDVRRGRGNPTLTVCVHFTDHVLQLLWCGVLSKPPHHNSNFFCGNPAIPIMVKHVECFFVIWGRHNKPLFAHS